MAPLPGVWGKPTSTLDWCEENYEITYFVAEFWNTVSNLAIVYFSLCGLWYSHKAQLERRYFLCYSLMTVVGIGSILFHMTLLYSMQLSDELPMLWASIVVLYTALEVHSQPKDTNFQLSAVLVISCLATCIIYMVVRNPLIHQIFYGFLVLLTTLQDLRTKHASTPMFMFGTLMFLTAFILWNIDNTFCSDITAFRSSIPGALRPVTQLHAWWHVLAGYGSYIHLVFSAGARCRFLNRPCQFRVNSSFEARWRAPPVP